MTIVITAKHIQESLVTLYLRLNGYYTSGHIVHATPDNLAVRERTEIDVFGLRLPYSREPETGNSPSNYLHVENGIIDVIVGEVKSGKEPIQFNLGIRDAKNMASALRRAGFTNNEEVLHRVARILTEQMIPQPINQPDTRIEITLDPSEDILYPTRIRPVLFHLRHPEPTRTQAWFVGYQEIMNFIWLCLRTEFQPDGCQREYDYHLWGPITESIVDYFKSENRHEPGTSEELVRNLLDETQ